MFTWIPIHKEAVRKILALPEPQQELLALLRGMNDKGLKVISLDDESQTGTIPLAEIDPLTFLASFNRGITEANRKENWRFLKEKWNLSADVPEDFAGIPVVHNMKSWFFPYAKKRDGNHVKLLWELVRAATDRPLGEVDAALFQRCLGLKVVTINNLTIGLFWINPDAYLPADKKTRAFVLQKGVGEKPVDYDSYRHWVDEVRSKVGTDYAKLSHDAHVWATETGEAEPEDDDKIVADRRFWVYAPGKKAKRWEEFYKAGILAIDWEALDDLRTYPHKDAIRQKLREEEGVASSKVNDTLACWQFAHVMKPGDIVFAKHGMGKLVGYGVVTGSYEYEAARSSYQHLRTIEWRTKGEWALPEDERLPVKTLTDITRFPDLVDRLSDLTGLDINTIQTPAPKTKAVVGREHVGYWWLNANPQIWSFETLAIGQRQTYSSHNENNNKRQKYKYFHEVRPGDILVGYVTSPQREIVGICRITRALYDAGDGERIEFEKIERLDKPVLYETLKATPELQNCEPLINHQGSLFKLTEPEYDVIRTLIDETNPADSLPPTPYTKQMALQDLFLSETQFQEALDALIEKQNLVLQGPPGVGKTFVAARIAKALIGSNDPSRIASIQFHQSYSYEDFIQGFRPTAKGTFDLRYGIFHQFCRRAQRDEGTGRRYVFIIDEINRGNLSRIFGELMMLIEADKRGKEWAIPLAYATDAEDKFYVPENLYVIGMMNTADRSLAMVDYALRRRFRFMTLRPEFASPAFVSHLATSGVDAALVKRIVSRMKALNDAIAADTKNLGPGYQIGHSYFCPRNGAVADESWYRRVVQSEIVPLIQEYWFDDDKKVDEQRAALLA